MKCRNCSRELGTVFVDLGTAPASNSFLEPAELDRGEVWYPLRAWVCDGCHLVQLEEFKPHSEIFSSGYVYFSSFSETWLAHARRYSEAIIPRLGLDPGSFVCEIASNDGYLLRNFVAAGIPCLGIEPTLNTALAAKSVGVESLVEFFGRDVARRIVADRGGADLVAANNVLAHVPDLDDFVGGVEILLKPEGTATFEFPSLLSLVLGNQFDTVYQEHFSYFSLHSASDVLERRGLRVYDVEELQTHGGSLRLHVCRESAGRPESGSVRELLERERREGILSPAFYEGFQTRVDLAKDALLEFLIAARRDGRKVAAYGAAAKGNTILNYAGIKRDLLPFVADASPHKQGKLLPGSRIPVTSPGRILEEKPDFVLILPWNLRHEISGQLGRIRDWNGRFVVAIPHLEVLP